MVSMMRDYRPLYHHLGFTTLFCFIIAVTTYTIWGDPLYLHFAISYGYGYSATLIFSCLKLFTHFSRYSRLVIGGALSLLLGTLNGWLWTAQYSVSLTSIIALGVVFSMMCYYYLYAREQQEKAKAALETMKRRQAEQDKQLLQSQLRQLQSQIEPHFLFNTLANVSALIDDEPDKARYMLEKLTTLLRISLKNHRSERVTLVNETFLLDAYLAIQKIRLGTRLSYSIKLESGLEHCILPPWLIQPLVENAIIHGIEPISRPGHIDIDITRFQKSKLSICVTDDGAGFAVNGGHGNGIGLSNIRARLESLFGKEATLSLAQQAGKPGVVSTLILPINEEQISACKE